MNRIKQIMQARISWTILSILLIAKTFAQASHTSTSQKKQITKKDILIAAEQKIQEDRRQTA